MDTLNQVEGALCEKYIEDGEKAVAQEYYTSAEKLFLTAIQSAGKFGSQSPLLFQSLDKLVSLYLMLKKYKQSESYVLRMLAIQEARLGVDHPEILERLEQLAFVYASQAKFSKAGPLYERILQIKEERLGGDHPQLIKCLSDIILMYRIQRQYEKAETLFPRVLSLVENSVGQDHPCLVAILEAYADTLNKNNRGGEASVMKFLAGRIRDKNKQSGLNGESKNPVEKSKTPVSRRSKSVISSAAI